MQFHHRERDCLHFLLVVFPRRNDDDKDDDDDNNNNILGYNDMHEQDT